MNYSFSINFSQTDHFAGKKCDAFIVIKTVPKDLLTKSCFYPPENFLRKHFTQFFDGNACKKKQLQIFGPKQFDKSFHVDYFVQIVSLGFRRAIFELHCYELLTTFKIQRA